MGFLDDIYRVDLRFPPLPASTFVFPSRNSMINRKICDSIRSIPKIVIARDLAKLKALNELILIRSGISRQSLIATRRSAYGFLGGGVKSDNTFPVPTIHPAPWLHPDARSFVISRACEVYHVFPYLYVIYRVMRWIPSFVQEPVVGRSSLLSRESSAASTWEG